MNNIDYYNAENMKKIVAESYAENIITLLDKIMDEATHGNCFIIILNDEYDELIKNLKPNVLDDYAILTYLGYNVEYYEEYVYISWKF